MTTQPTMPGFEDDPAVLRGDGRYGFTARVEGDDLVVRGVRATWFGGAHDPEDNGQTASGVSTRLHPDLLGCALPMNGFRLTRGSPLPDLPWMTTTVDIYHASNNRRLTVPLIDLGPAAPPHAHAAIDLTVAAFRALGGNPEMGSLQIDFRIRGGAHRLPAAVLAAVRTSRREEPTPTTPRTAIGTDRPAPGSCSPAPAALPPAADAAGASARAAAAVTAPGGTAAGRVGRSVPPQGGCLLAAAAVGLCLVSTACAAARSSAVFPETFSLIGTVGRDDAGGWDRETLGVGFTWRLKQLPVTRTVPAGNPGMTQP